MLENCKYSTITFGKCDKFIGHYKILKKIGYGSYGVVYHVLN